MFLIVLNILLLHVLKPLFFSFFFFFCYKVLIVKSTNILDTIFDYCGLTNNSKIRIISHTTSYILFEEYGVENCIIELIETKSCKDKDELRKLEGHYIRSLKCVNEYVLGRTCRTGKQ